MRALTQSVHVERPPDAVWALLTDLERAPRWRPLIKRMATADGGPLAA